MKPPSSPSWLDIDAHPVYLRARELARGRADLRRNVNAVAVERLSNAPVRVQVPEPVDPEPMQPPMPGRNDPQPDLPPAGKPHPIGDPDPKPAPMSVA